MGDSVISKMICLHDSLTFLILAPAHKNIPSRVAAFWVMFF